MTLWNHLGGTLAGAALIGLGWTVRNRAFANAEREVREEMAQPLLFRHDNPDTSNLRLTHWYRFISYILILFGGLVLAYSVAALLFYPDLSE